MSSYFDRVQYRRHHYQPKGSAVISGHPLFEYSMDGIALLDQDGVIQQVNPAFLSILQIGNHNLLLGMNIKELICKDYLDNFNAVLELSQYLSGPLEPIEMDICYESENTLTAFVSLVNIVVDRQRMIQMTIRDISEWKQIQTHLIQANMDLSQAYRDTLDGWGRALELRDHETEGHTRRVTEATVNLALTMGLPVEEIMNIRHGAMLHDIGKMAIPDAILLKPGPLDPEEWRVMRLHPVYARDMLSQIDYLRPAVDIPYCHHEKWDGSGYPLGLKGDEIPVSARIFAIVDVWDALLSDRPYRKGWPEEKVYQYITENERTHFDPAVVGMFLDAQNQNR